MESIDIEKHFISGKYIIREIVCSQCRHQVGWRYVEAMQDENQFKVNHYVLEVSKTFLQRPKLDIIGRDLDDEAFSDKRWEEIMN